MAAFDKLPYETLSQILSELCKSDLARVSLVNRRLSEVSEPLLYQAPFLASQNTPLLYCISLDRFLQTLIDSPRTTLVNHVRYLTLTWDHSSGLHSVTFPATRFQCPTGFHGANAVFILHLLPSVDALSIRPPPDLPGARLSYFTQCIEQLHNAPHASLDSPTFRLQSLREFSCPFRERGGSITVRAVWALMNLPCIDLIDAYIIDAPGLYSDHSIPEAARFAPVTRLRFAWKDMSLSSLGLLVNAPVALTHFAYLGVGETQFHMVDFMDTIAPLRPSLEHLNLELVRVSVALTSTKVDRLRSSLRSWPVLETLSCSAVELLGNVFVQETLCLPDVLPRSLRALRILEDRYSLYHRVVDMVVDELVRRKEDVLPALEMVSLRNWSNEWDGDEAYERLGVACVKAGVRLEDDDWLWW